MARALSSERQKRCTWATTHPLLEAYHDAEWGVPIHDDRHWYEKLVLDGAQAGLSWLTILKKREGYRAAFANFDVQAVSRFGKREEAALLNDAGIVRNRLKIRSAIKNAQGFVAIQEEFGSFDAFIWNFTDGQVVQNRHRSQSVVPATSPLSDQVSKELKRRGFSFVGSTIVYAFLQAGGVINDHITSCFRFAELGGRPKARATRRA